MLETNLLHKNVVQIRGDQGREFENSYFDNIYNKYGIRNEFSAPKTPQHNGVVEQKNKTLKRDGLYHTQSKKVPILFWGKALNTSCYIQNQVYLRP